MSFKIWLGICITLWTLSALSSVTFGFQQKDLKRVGSSLFKDGGLSLVDDYELVSQDNWDNTRNKRENEDVCILPLEEGECRSAFQKFYYDSEGRECRSFIYGGCGGNGNLFDSLEECQLKCDSDLEPKLREGFTRDMMLESKMENTITEDCSDLSPEDEVLIKSRLKNEADIINSENMLLPTSPKSIWKTELLDLSFSIIMKACPPAVVQKNYMHLVRETFLYHIDKVWETKPEKYDGIFEANWDALIFRTSQCLANVNIASHQLHNVSRPENADVLRLFTVISDPSAITDELHDDINLNIKYDWVIETVWLVANHVAATCHHALDYAQNFWTSYINMFQEMYLTPLIPQWKNPGSSNNAYRFILGGYGIQNQFNRIGLCTTAAMDYTPNLECFERPVDLEL